MKRIKPATGEIYHAYNRGVEKRVVFLENFDYLRFIHDLYEFNDSDPSPKLYIPAQFSEVRLPKIMENMEKKPRKLLVEILAFCLMPNHFHILLKQKIDGGISQFMQKLGTGYTNYFNQKYTRVGSLFQGKYKAVHIVQENHFLHLPYYIHLNPLDLVTPEWRDRKIKNLDESLNFLKKYKWSSYLDYIGIKNFPSITQRDFLLKFFDDHKNYQVEITKWLKELNLDQINDLILE